MTPLCRKAELFIRREEGRIEDKDIMYFDVSEAYRIKKEYNIFYKPNYSCDRSEVFDAEKELSHFMLPFPKCCFVFEGESKNGKRSLEMILVSKSDITGKFYADHISKTEEDVYDYPQFCFEIYGSEVLIKHNPMNFYKGFAFAGANPKSYYSVAFLNFLFCIDALETRREAYTTKLDWKSRMLLAKGKPLNKPPAISWKTVTIEAIKPKAQESNGGTHASPRLHDRRGHWRNCSRSGRRVWVRDCKVGDASRGLVLKDYKLKGGEIERDESKST